MKNKALWIIIVVLVVVAIFFIYKNRQLKSQIQQKVDATKVLQHQIDSVNLLNKRYIKSNDSILFVVTKYQDSLRQARFTTIIKYKKWDEKINVVNGTPINGVLRNITDGYFNK